MTTRAILGGAAPLLLVLLLGAACFGGEEIPAPNGVELEEVQVSEPLTQETDEALREQIQTIQAVRRPEEGGASAGENLEPLAEDRAELEQQCVTALKEIAFCTNDDAFSDLIGTHRALAASDQRDRFMEKVHFWFEPGGARVDCRVVSTDEEAMSDENRRMWQRAATATDQVCAEFGRELLAAEALERLAPLWAPTARLADPQSSSQ